jgi:hypothetical protein
MSHSLINHNPDLKRLRDEGYAVEIKAAHVLVHDIPYINSDKQIKFGVLVSTLNLAGERTQKPETHKTHFIGEQPCNKAGQEISQIKHNNNKHTLAKGIEVDRTFSNKPKSGYSDYYEKMTRYADIISGPANSLDPSVTPKTFRPIQATEEESVFNFIDTASSRAGITALTSKFEGLKISIIGLGGTGAYVLDQVSKTPVQEIHLFDRDLFLLHNAFRAPGAPTLEQLNCAPKKVKYFAEMYSNLHKRIIQHPYHIDETNLHELHSMDYVFICVDDGDARRLISDELNRAGISFIDSGMGLDLTDDHLGGVLRITASTDEKNDHTDGRLPFANDNVDNAYTQNIQIADLNAFNALMAVIKWKKMCGFYRDFKREHHTTYTIDVNMTVNDDAVSNDDESLDDDSSDEAAQ